MKLVAVQVFSYKYPLKLYLERLQLNKSILFFELQIKAGHDQNLNNSLNVFHHIYLSITLIDPCFLGAIYGLTFIMIKLRSLWYNCIYLSNFETLSNYINSAVMQNLVIIRLISTKANSYSNFITCSPSLCRTLVVLSINTFWWAPFVVQLTLHWNFSKAFAVSSQLISLP